MKSLFNLDNPFFQFLSRVADLIIANVLFLICSIPIVTIGAATAGLNKVTQDMVLGTEGKLVSTFFSAFKSNFKQATIVWLVILFLIVGLVCDYLLINAYFEGTAAFVMLVLLVVLAVLMVAVSCYMFPLLVRYQNRLREHLFNSIILSMVKLPRTLGMLVLHCFALIILAVSPVAFIQTLIFWIMIGFSLVSYLDSTLLRPVFKELESDADSSVDLMN